VLSEKLTVAQLLRELPAAYKTAHFTSVFASEPLNPARSQEIQFATCFFMIHFNIILMSESASSK
jgi:hypothetical protein